MNAFSKHDLRVTIEEGQPALLACHAPESYPDRNIYWSKVKDRGHFPVQQDTTSHFSTSLTGDLYFSYTTRSDEGVYYCSVENSKLRRFERRTVSLNVNRSKWYKNNFKYLFFNFRACIILSLINENSLCIHSFLRSTQSSTEQFISTPPKLVFILD